MRTVSASSGQSISHGRQNQQVRLASKARPQAIRREDLFRHGGQAPFRNRQPGQAAPGYPVGAFEMGLEIIAPALFRHFIQSQIYI